MKPLTAEEIKELELQILLWITSLCEQHNLRYYLFAGTLLGAVRHGGFIPWDDDIDIAMPREDFEKLEQICRLDPQSPYTFMNWRDDWRLCHNISKVCDMRTVWIEEARDGFRVELGVFVDIFPMDGAPKGRWRKVLHGLLIIAHRLMLRAAALDVHDRRKPFIKRVLARAWQIVAGERLIKLVHANLDRLCKKYSFDQSDEWASYLDYRGLHHYMPKSWVGQGARVSFEGHELLTFASWHEYLTLTYGDYMTPPPPAERKSSHEFQAWWKEPGTS